MNKVVGSYSKKAPLHPQNGKKKMELQGPRKPPSAEKTMAARRRLARERKSALLQEVENLKKKLRHEENVHRALERAFNRPLGVLPRLPPYLPQYTLELLAEVAVLEEEVVRLEEQVVNFRQGIYQEAVNMSSRKSPDDSTVDESSSVNSRRRHSRSSSQGDISLGSFKARPLPSFPGRKLLPRDIPSESLANGKHPALLSKDGLHEDYETCPNSDKDKSFSVKKSKNVNSPKIQYRTADQAPESSSGSSEDRHLEGDSEANKLSEDTLKCLIRILIRLSSPKRKTMDSDSFSSLTSRAFGENNGQNFQDPYCQFSKFKKREIGPYKHLRSIEAHSVNFNQKSNAMFLIRRLKLLLNKLASVKLDDLSHHQKLAFWINIYNSCIMNAFLEHGIPDDPDMIVVHMQKATIKVGGHVLNALMIEHLILRLPYHLKYTCNKPAKNEESKICRTLGLEWSEPLVTFALSCGSWSSPAVRVYTASKIDAELETAKQEYLQAAVGLSMGNELIIPKLLDWYILDFAKDLESLLDWVCLQLPDKARDEAVKWLGRSGKEPLCKLVQVMPYKFDFRYLVHL